MGWKSPTCPVVVVATPRASTASIVPAKSVWLARFREVGRSRDWLNGGGKSSSGGCSGGCGMGCFAGFFENDFRTGLIKVGKRIGLLNEGSYTIISLREPGDQLKNEAVIRHRGSYARQLIGQILQFLTIRIDISKVLKPGIDKFAFQIKGPGVFVVIENVF